MELALIQEHKDRQIAVLERNPALLHEMQEEAKMRSSGASNRIECIATTDKRLEQLMNGQIELKNDAETEIIGYRYCLDRIYRDCEDIELTPEKIVSLHRDLFRFYPDPTVGGKFRTTPAMDLFLGGEVRFRNAGMPPDEIPQALQALCGAYAEARGRNAITPLILNLLFALDFIEILPFERGNGRMSRLLLLVSLYRLGYYVPLYVSFEGLIEKTKTNYYDALVNSSLNWRDGTNDPWEFIRYMLGILITAYKELEARVK